MRILFLIPGGPQEQLRILPLAAAVAQQLRVQLQVACPAASASVWKLLPAVEKLLPEFEREHPGLHVSVQQLPLTAAHQKLLTAYEDTRKGMIAQAEAKSGGVSTTTKS